MSIREKGALAEEIHRRQPHMLASCLVQSKLGVEPTAVEFLLNILLVCYQSMQESGLHTTYSLPVSRRTGNSALPRLTMTAIIGPLLRHYRGRDPLQACKVGAIVAITMTKSPAAVPGLPGWFYVDRIRSMIEKGIVTVVQERKRPVDWVVCLACKSPPNDV